MIAAASRSCSSARRCSYQPIASASSISEVRMRARVRISADSSEGGSWYCSVVTRRRYPPRYGRKHLAALDQLDTVAVRILDEAHIASELKTERQVKGVALIRIGDAVHGVEVAGHGAMLGGSSAGRGRLNKRAPMTDHAQ